MRLQTVKLKELGKQSLSLSLILLILLPTFFNILALPVYAASTPWAQTDWSGGSGQTAWSDATKFDSSSNIDTTTTSGQASLSVAEKLANSAFASNNTSWSVAAVPPSGWVEVPGNSTYSTTNFLSMKYEAKNVGGVATSQAASTPYVSISQTSAITACSALGASYHLQTNNEWMTIARDAEAQAGNWTLGSVGSGYLFAGHNDNAPAAAKAASTTDTGDYRCAYTDTAGTTENPTSCPTNTANNTSGTAGNQVRTLTLSNGAVIWDIAGNVWEWTNDIQSSTINTTVGWVEWNHANIASGARALYGPSSASYLSANGMGQVYGGALNNAFGRGGGWSDGADAGAFALGLDYTPSATNASFGFRCASDPVAISQSFSSSSGRSGAGGNSVTIGSVSDGKIYQSVNVGDTSTYNLSAYVYNNTAGSIGGTVDTNVAQLYYGGNTISSAAWTAVSGETGWYKLTGTVTGIASGVDSGVLVKTGKTVIIDDVSLSKEYNTSGTLTSSIFDSEFTIGAAWGTLTYTSSGSTVTIKARTSNSSSMTGATDFSSCTAITSGSDISSNSCVTDGHRYIQYQLALSTGDTASTPTFSDISIAFATFDADAPSISLTALTPDPNSDNTPTLSGTATESVGTVSNVQFQMDSTSGSWNSCTADDGTFDEASETFSCTASTLTDGSHTMYVRATDSNSNTTSNANASTDTFTIDATAPVSIDLDSPGDNSYTNSERPTYKWKATTDATAGLSKYVLEIDNPSIGSSQPSGDFTIDNIPTSGTTDITSNNKYVIHFDGFSDSDTTNNYISVYTRSTNDWGSSENDGKLREGRVSWKVKAVDNAGNEASSSRTLFVDRTSPSVEFTQVNGIATSQAPRNDGMTTTDKTPTIFGKITDPLSGGDSIATLQNDTGPKVASGPKSVEIKIEKVEKVLGVVSNNKLITIYTINMDKALWTCTNKEITDNSKQKCNKYLPFEYTLKENLDLGQYKITLSGKDKADNSSSEVTLTLNITTLSQITTPAEKKIIEDEILKQVQDDKPLTPEQQEQVKQELEITKPTGEVPTSALEKLGNNITKTTSVIASVAWQSLTDITNKIASSVNLLAMTIGDVFNGVGSGIAFAYNTVNSINAFVNDKTFQGLAFVGNGVGTGISSIAQAIGSGYNNIAEHSPGVTKNILLAIGNGFSTTSHVIASGSEAISNTGKIAASAIGNGFLAMTRGVQNGIANIAFAIGEKTDDVSHEFGTTIIKIGYIFVPEPTRIVSVKVAKSTPTSMTITWVTNHPASGKVNYGLTADYGQDVQTDKRITHHEFTVTGLKPNTTYFYEVMSQNRNYVYDANHTFTTPGK